MRQLIVFTCVLTLITIAMPAMAGSMREEASRPAGYWGDQKGCYWAEGRHYCSKYCYWEADGRRYCQSREQLARPTGAPQFVPYPPEPPIYVRPPAGRN